MARTKTVFTGKLTAGSLTTDETGQYYLQGRLTGPVAHHDRQVYLCLTSSPPQWWTDGHSASQVKAFEARQTAERMRELARNLSKAAFRLEAEARGFSLIQVIEAETCGRSKSHEHVPGLCGPEQ